MASRKISQLDSGSPVQPSDLLLVARGGNNYKIPASEFAVAGALQANANLSDLSDAAAARNNLGLGSAATQSATAFASSAQGETADAALQPSGNLAGLANPATARSNLGLGTAATQSTGAFATAAQGGTADAALPKAGGTLSGDLEIAKAIPRLRLRDTGQGSDANAYWDVLASTFPWGSSPTVRDYTWGLQFNEQGLVTGQPRWGENIEPRYVGAANEVAPPNGDLEKNWSYTSIDGLTTRRPFQFTINLNTHLASMKWEVGKFYVIGNGDAVGVAESIYVNTANKAVSMAGGLSIGAIGETVTYPLYVTIRTGGRCIVASPVATNSDICFSATPTGTATGNLQLIEGIAAANGLVYTMTRNTGSGTGMVAIQGGSSGDAQIRFETSGLVSIGMDRSDSNNFKVSMGSTLGASDALIITSAMHISLGATIKPKSYTVATLPTASTVGAGGNAYSSNARKAGEGAAAGTGIPVWCDGTNWRTYYDNAVAAA